MNAKFKLFIYNKKKELINTWYEFVKPLGDYLSKKEKMNYQKVSDRITEEQAIKWFAGSIMHYLIRNSNEFLPLVIASWIDEEYLPGYQCMADHTFTSLLRKKKYRMAYYKFNKDFAFQEKVVDRIRKQKGIVIQEVVENFSYGEPRDYKKTYFIKLDYKK